MADVYCDQSLTTGLDDGTTWANAYKLLGTALDGTNVVAGDTLWVMNDQLTSGSVALKMPLTYTNNPPRVIGVSPGASAPPTAAQIVPGIRTGQSAAAYTHADAPILALSTGGASFTLEGHFGLIYGLVLKAVDNWGLFSSGEGLVSFEECELRAGDGESGIFVIGHTAGSRRVHGIFKNSKLSAGTNGQLSSSNRVGLFEFYNTIFDIPNDPMLSGQGPTFLFSGCDFSAQSGALISFAGGSQPRSRTLFYNCKFNATSDLVSGSIAEDWRTEFIQTSSTTGKTTGGSFLELSILTSHGNIEVETTRVRTGGAGDGGDGSFSHAFTPGVNGTRTNHIGLVGPWMHFEIVGDGTSQTVTVFIANNLADDAGNKYNDDDVWLEIESPPAADGGANWDRATTQMDLEVASPTEITTETDSTWGTGANNRQKLSKAISPDYNGVGRCRVVFAKNFSASPDTLYVDPLPVVS